MGFLIGAGVGVATILWWGVTWFLAKRVADWFGRDK